MGGLSFGKAEPSALTAATDSSGGSGATVCFWPPALQAARLAFKDVLSSPPGAPQHDLASWAPPIHTSNATTPTYGMVVAWTGAGGSGGEGDAPVYSAVDAIALAQALHAGGHLGVDGHGDEPKAQ